jgi:hypothetical protein
VVLEQVKKKVLIVMDNRKRKWRNGWLEEIPVLIRKMENEKPEEV